MNHELELSSAIDSIESKYYASGTTGKGLALTLSGSTTPINFPLSVAQAEQSLPPLLAASTVSAFGLGSETVVNPSVR
eukprot:2738532-Pyramimonas_sp.AAC.1